MAPLLDTGRYSVRGLGHQDCAGERDKDRDDQADDASECHRGRRYMSAVVVLNEQPAADHGDAYPEDGRQDERNGDLDGDGSA